MNVLSEKNLKSIMGSRDSKGIWSSPLQNLHFVDFDATLKLRLVVQKKEVKADFQIEFHGESEKNSVFVHEDS
jgi:hypothetical protein